MSAWKVSCFFHTFVLVFITVGRWQRHLEPASVAINKLIDVRFHFIYQFFITIFKKNRIKAEVKSQKLQFWFVQYYLQRVSSFRNCLIPVDKLL